MDSREWQFQFVVSSNDGSPITEDGCSELLDAIIEHAESKGLTLGGGFNPAGDED